MLTELQAPIYDVRGPRLRADWRVNDWLLLYASYAFFEDRSVRTSPLALHDPYGGAELRWNHGQSHFFPSGGYRLEWDEALHGEHQHVGHIEWDGTQALPHGLSVETQGFVLMRNEPLLMVRPWTEGNVVRPLVHGRTYYRALADSLAATGEGDSIQFVGWRADADQLE